MPILSTGWVVRQKTWWLTLYWDTVQSSVNKPSSLDNTTVASGCKWCTLHLKSWECTRTIPEPLPKVKRRTELKSTCANSQILVVAVGPKLAEAYAAYLRFCKKHQDIIQLTPGTFRDFSSTEHATLEGSKFRILTFGRGDPEDFSLKGIWHCCKSSSWTERQILLLDLCGSTTRKTGWSRRNLAPEWYFQMSADCENICWKQGTIERTVLWGWPCNYAFKNGRASG